MVEKLVLCTFLKESQNWVYLWISILMYKLLLLFVQAKDYQDVLKLRCWKLAFATHRMLSKNKKSYGTSFLATFSLWFLDKNKSYVRL